MLGEHLSGLKEETIEAMGQEPMVVWPVDINTLPMDQQWKTKDVDVVYYVPKFCAGFPELTEESELAGQITSTVLDCRGMPNVMWIMSGDYLDVEVFRKEYKVDPCKIAPEVLGNIDALVEEAFDLEMTEKQLDEQDSRPEQLSSEEEKQLIRARLVLKKRKEMVDWKPPKKRKASEE